jgi:hypothetical protein
VEQAVKQVGILAPGFLAFLRGNALREVHEVQLHDFAVLRDPDLINQFELDGIFRTLDGDANQAVPECEHYSLEHSAVVVVDADHVVLIMPDGKAFG